MPDGQSPLIASDLRRLCDGWPQAVVRRAVATVVPEPNAALITAWLTDPDASADAPPLSPDVIDEIVRRLQAQRHEPRQANGLS
jgi:hypothetical protein